MAEVDTSIYKQAPTNPLDNIAKVVGVVGGINANALFQQTYQARQAVGEAYRRNTNPDGTLNEEGLRRDLGASGFGAGEALGQGIANTTANFNLNKARNDYIVGTLGAASNNPNLTPQSVVGTLLTLGRNAGIPPDMIHGLTTDILTNPKYKNHEVLRGRLNEFQNMVLAGQGSQRVEGPPEPGTGAPTKMPLAAANAAGRIPVGPPLGSNESATAMMADQAREGTFQSEMVPWQKARDLLHKLPEGSTGPGSPGRQQLEEFVWALSPTVARWAGVSPEKISNYGQLQKYLTQATLSRANSLGGNGTDMQLAQAITGNPHVQINDLTNKQVVDMAIAVRRMEHAQVVDAAKAGPVGYLSAKTTNSTYLDPRAFGIDFMSKAQIENLKKNLKGTERDRFNRSLQMAIQSGVIIPPRQ